MTPFSVCDLDIKRPESPFYHYVDSGEGLLYFKTVNYATEESVIIPEKWKNDVAGSIGDVVSGLQPHAGSYFRILVLIALHTIC
jgi:hypothetical protein